MYTHRNQQDGNKNKHHRKQGEDEVSLLSENIGIFNTVMSDYTVVNA